MIRPKLGELSAALAALTLYIVATIACLRLAWFIPGQGLEIILIRLGTATILPGCLVVLLAPKMQRPRQRAVRTGLLLGMCCITIVYLIGAVVLAGKFRL